MAKLSVAALKRLARADIIIAGLAASGDEIWPHPPTRDERESEKCLAIDYMRRYYGTLADKNG